MVAARVGGGAEGGGEDEFLLLGGREDGVEVDGDAEGDEEEAPDAGADPVGGLEGRGRDELGPEGGGAGGGKDGVWGGGGFGGRGWEGLGCAGEEGVEVGGGGGEEGGEVGDGAEVEEGLRVRWASVEVLAIEGLGDGCGVLYIYWCGYCYLQKGILGQVLMTWVVRILRAQGVARSRRRNPRSRHRQPRLRNRQSRRQSHRYLQVLRLCLYHPSPPLPSPLHLYTSWGQSHRLLLLDRRPSSTVLEHRTLNAWICSEKKLVNLTLSLVRWTTSRKCGGAYQVHPLFSLVHQAPHLPSAYRRPRCRGPPRELALNRPW